MKEEELGVPSLPHSACCAVECVVGEKSFVVVVVAREVLLLLEETHNNRKAFICADGEGRRHGSSECDGDTQESLVEVFGCGGNDRSHRSAGDRQRRVFVALRNVSHFPIGSNPPPTSIDSFFGGGEMLMITKLRTLVVLRLSVSLCVVG